MKNKPFEILRSKKLYTGDRFPETEEELTQWVDSAFITDGVGVNETTGTDMFNGYCDLEIRNVDGPRLYLTLCAKQVDANLYDFYISDGMVGVPEDCNDLSSHPALASYALDQCFKNEAYADLYSISDDDIEKPETLPSYSVFVASFRDPETGRLLKYKKKEANSE